MRHRVKGRKLGRTASHRLATLRALTTALLKHKKIKTTLAKAKTLRTFAEPLITKAKVDSVANRRLVAKHINDKDVVKELFGEIVEKIGDRAGGYTRIVKLGNRLGDAAEMAIIELVDYNDLGDKKEKKVKASVKGKGKTKAVEVEEVETEVVDADEVKAKAKSKAKANVDDAEVIEEVTEEAPEETKAEAKAETEVKESDNAAKDVKAEAPKEEEKPAKTEAKPKVSKAKTKKDKK